MNDTLTACCSAHPQVVVPARAPLLKARMCASLLSQPSAPQGLGHRLPGGFKIKKEFLNPVSQEPHLPLKVKKFLKVSEKF